MNASSLHFVKEYLKSVRRKSAIAESPAAYLREDGEGVAEYETKIVV